MEREPSSSRRFTMCSGDGPIFTLRMMRAVYRAQPCGVFDDDGEMSAFSRCSPFGSFGSTGLQVDAVDGRRLARHAVVVHGVHAIGGQVHLVDGRAVLFLDGLHGDAGRGQVFGELTIVGRDVDELTQPCG